MPQPIVSDTFEKQAEQGQAPAAQKPLPKKPTPLSKPSSGLDWLETGFGQKSVGDDQVKKANEQAAEKKHREELTRLDALDKRQSKQMYQQIQDEIHKWQKIREQEKRAGTGKNTTGAAGYDPEQHQDPEGFWEKMKKKQEEAKKKLPWTSKQGMGTGEITRGVSG